MILVFNYKENFIFLFVGYDKIFNYMVLNSYLNYTLLITIYLIYIYRKYWKFYFLENRENYLHYLLNFL